MRGDPLDNLNFQSERDRECAGLNLIYSEIDNYMDLATRDSNLCVLRQVKIFLEEEWTYDKKV
jgi:hypothetical protein